MKQNRKNKTKRHKKQWKTIKNKKLNDTKQAEHNRKQQKTI